MKIPQSKKDKDERQYKERRMGLLFDLIFLGAIATCFAVAICLFLSGGW